MLEGQEVTQQDANQPESSAPEQTSTQENQEIQSQPEPKAEAQAPFHEHPRFKELIEEKKQYSQQLRQMQEQMAEMQRRYETQKTQQPTKAHPFVEKLKEIDPTYGEWAGGVEELKAQLAELKEWKQEQARQSIVKEYESTVDRLHAEHKVPDELKARIRKELDYVAMTNPKLGLKDLPEVYKSVYEDYSKWMEGIKRSSLMAYGAEKKQDASAPASPSRGKAVSPSGKPTQHADKDAAFKSIVSKTLKQVRAGSDI